MAKKPAGLGKGFDNIFFDNSIEEKSGVTRLRIGQIEPKADQPRRVFEGEALAELADSIAAHGVLQPILVREIADGHYQIIAGERRYRASKMAGLTEVPVIVLDKNDLETAQISLIENIQREDLNPIEEAQAYRALIRQCFIPMWDADTAALAMANVRRLCRSTPVYRMFADPSKEAALETHRTLFERPEEIQEELPDMKIREGFVLRNVADEHMVMPTGENVGKFGGAVVLSDVAAFAFEQLKHPASREDLLSLILAEYDVDAETATADLDALLAQFREMNLLED